MLVKRSGQSLHRDIPHERDTKLPYGGPPVAVRPLQGRWCRVVEEDALPSCHAKGNCMLQLAQVGQSGQRVLDQDGRTQPTPRLTVTILLHALGVEAGRDGGDQNIY